MSDTPSEFRSPMEVMEMPKVSKSAMDGPFAVEEFISIVACTLPSAAAGTGPASDITWTAPWLAPPVTSSPGAPTAISGTPSEFMSPTRATDRPKPSLPVSDGPPEVESSTLIVPLMVPSGFISMTCTAPLSELPVSSPGAPTEMSRVPSPFTSPIPATEEPKKSEFASDGPLGVFEVPFISIVRFTVPSGFISMTWTVPRSVPPVSANGAPAAMSDIPSESRSPMSATEEPNRPSSVRDRPRGVEESISMVLLTVPSGFISMTWTAPRLRPPPSSPDAPAAMSGTPSESRSPMPATEEPKVSEFARSGPWGVLDVPFISMVSLTVPSGFISMTWTVPRSVPPVSANGAPAAMSGVPSPSRSPIPATEEPKVSSSESDGPWGVLDVPFISMVSLTVPSGFISMMWTVPRLEPPVSSPDAPAAMSCTPSPSKSPIRATEKPNWSKCVSDGPFAVSESVLATCTGYSRPESTGCGDSVAQAYHPSPSPPFPIAARTTRRHAARDAVRRSEVHVTVGPYPPPLLPEGVEGTDGNKKM